MSDYNKKNEQPNLLDGKPEADKPKKEIVKADTGTENNALTGKQNNAQLTPVRKVQAEVMRYATALFDKDRATEFATRVALIAKDNDKLNQAISRNPDSFLAAYMASVTLDLMPNTPQQHAHIIPYGDKVQFQTGYKGLIALARRSGEIKTIAAELVFKGDIFHVRLGTDRTIEHEPNFDVDRTNYDLVTHAYGTALLTNGETVFVVMTRKELDKIQRTVKSSSSDTPWKQWPERQAIKTVLKRLTQLLPSSAEDLQKAVALDSLAEAGKLRLADDGRIIEGEEGLSSLVKERISNATSADDLQDILNSLTPKEKVLAQPLIEEKFAEL